MVAIRNSGKKPHVPAAREPQLAPANVFVPAAAGTFSFNPRASRFAAPVPAPQRRGEGTAARRRLRGRAVLRTPRRSLYCPRLGLANVARTVPLAVWDAAIAHALAAGFEAADIADDVDCVGHEKLNSEMALDVSALLLYLRHARDAHAQGLQASQTETQALARAVQMAVLVRLPKTLEQLLDGGASQIARTRAADSNLALLATRVSLPSISKKASTALTKLLDVECSSKDVIADQVSMLRVLLRHGADPNATCSQGQPALHIAIDRFRSVEAVRLLVSHGASLKSQDKTTGVGTPLHLACRAVHVGSVRVLLEHGAPPGSTSGRSTPLLEACAKRVSSDTLAKKAATIAELLLEAGASPNAPNAGGAMPLHVAALVGNAHVVRVLLQHKVRVNVSIPNGVGTPLNVACSKGFVPIVELLLEAPSFAPTPSDGHAVLLVATRIANVVTARALTKLLLGHRALRKAILRDAPKCELAGSAASIGDVEMLQMLLDAGAPVSPPEGVDTPLHIAVNSGVIAAVQLLLDRGASVHTLDSKGLAPLHVAAAVEENAASMVELLVRHGATPDVVIAPPGTPQTPLHVACRAARVDACRALLELGADVHGGMRADLQTPLELVCSVAADDRRPAEASTDVVRLLLDHGASTAPRLVLDSEASEDDGAANCSALHNAVRFSPLAAVELLIERGAPVNAGIYVHEFRPLDLVIVPPRPDIAAAVRRAGGTHTAKGKRPAGTGFTASERRLLREATAAGLLQ